MRAKLTSLLLIPLWLSSVCAWAADENPGEVNLFARSSYVGLRCRRLQLPKDILEKNAKSGLTTSILAVVIMADAHGHELNQQWNVRYHYDLWDERFILELEGPGGTLLQESIKTESMLFEKLANLKLFPMLSKSQWSFSGPVATTLHLILDPIEKEKMQQIRHWIAENTVSPSANTTTSFAGNKAIANNAPNAPNTGVTPLRFSNLFERILNNQPTGDHLGTWTLTLTGLPKALAEIENEK